jgi:hypothetical protein
MNPSVRVMLMVKDRAMAYRRLTLARAAREGDGDDV